MSAGWWLSPTADVAAGAAIVLVASAAFVVSALAAPCHGVLAGLLARRAAGRRAGTRSTLAAGASSR